MVILQKNCFVSFIYGKPKSGKSHIARLLVKKLHKTEGIEKVNFCEDFDILTPSDSFVNLYTTVNPTASRPLVVKIDEIDGIIERIHNGKVFEPNEFKVFVNNKSSWNGFLDAFDNNKYPYVYLIMTSNKSIDILNKLDSSYLRKNRIDGMYELNQERE